MAEAITTTQLKFISLGQHRFETCQCQRVFLSKHALPFIHRWFRWTLMSAGLGQVDTTTESKSGSLAPPGFETRRQVFFSLGAHLGIHSWIISSEINLEYWVLGTECLSQEVATTELKSVSLAPHRFETCRCLRFFLSKHALTFTHRWFH
jgi:hypothetical protein